MALSDTQELLIDGLRFFPLSLSNAAIIFLMMDTEDKQFALMEFLASTPNASEKEIMAQAQSIAKK